MRLRAAEAAGRGIGAGRAVILDRDGVLNRDTGHVWRSAEFEWGEDSVAAVRWLNRNGNPVVVVTNQAGIAKGMYTEDDFRVLMDWVDGELAAQGAHLDGIYYCPHHPTVGRAPYLVACSCRKPKPGLLLEALEDLGVSASDCVMIGDMPSDRDAAAAVGVQYVMYSGGSLLALVRKVLTAAGGAHA